MNVPTFKIKEVTEEMLPELKKLMLKYIVDFYKCPQPTDENLTNHVLYLLENPQMGKQFMIQVDNKSAGFATLYYTFSTTKVAKIAILNDLYIDSDYRKQEFGEELFKFCLSYTRENNFSTMSWKTAVDNYVAQSLYDKMGGMNTNQKWINYEIIL
ncbi:GNAT family N-acetyltransferase [Aneurinibacillus thermoaerophilus]|uniref:GNAT family N-acetyltransferase n=4 Tax=Aneurinibacillus group TaxID=85151 RepID=A0ABX8YCI0_ANETH|nr:GNAT family N-acetyltransferase [Aneurinibacillus thermoaerophilus]QYY43040.1 GNAT family N-acetyltransferase [Aneurinibacillus thermoaerophilus]